MLGFALTLGEELAGAPGSIPLCDPGAYDPKADVDLRHVIEPFDCTKTCAYVVTHGWASSADAPAIRDLGFAIKEHCPQCNVLQVDWSEGSSGLPRCVAKRIDAAGDEAERQIRNLYRSWCGTDPPDAFWDQVTYVGHSFGNSINQRIAKNHGKRGKAVILDPPSPWGGRDPNYDGAFLGGSVSINSGGPADANPCNSPRVAGDMLKLINFTPAPSDFDPFAHGAALRCLTKQLKDSTGSCDNQILKGNWSTSAQYPGWYDGSLSCDGTLSMSPSRPPCAESMLPPGVRVALAVVRLVMPVDPNEKTGPEGEGDDHLVSTLDDLEYTIYFENAPHATAPVQEAIITDDLSSHLDWATFQLQEIAFGDKIVPIDGGLRSGDNVPLAGCGEEPLGRDTRAGVGVHDSPAPAGNICQIARQWTARRYQPRCGLRRVSRLLLPGGG